MRLSLIAALGLTALTIGACSTATPSVTLTSTPTPEPPPSGSASSAPGPVKINFDGGIVVAFADDPNRGRIAYVTHVSSGAQTVLDAEGEVIERHDSPGAGMLGCLM